MSRDNPKSDTLIIIESPHNHQPWYSQPCPECADLDSEERLHEWQNLLLTRLDIQFPAFRGPEYNLWCGCADLSLAELWSRRTCTNEVPVLCVFVACSLSKSAWYDQNKNAGLHWSSCSILGYCACRRGKFRSIFLIQKDLITFAGPYY